MKRLGNIWPQIVDFSNLLIAYRKARRGKRTRDEVAAFSMDLEHQLLRLQKELHSGEYRPGAYRLFTIYERKPRIISVAPFRDRVVHHAIMNAIEPSLDRTFIHDSYACRKGRGTHAAVARYRCWAQRYIYALKLDIAKYFPSVDHDILKHKLRRRIKDRETLALLDIIIDASPQLESPAVYFSGDDLFTPIERRRGLPIGNLTSQFFANLYLDDFDHYVKETLRVRPYLRYVDDMVLLDDDKTHLTALRALLTERLRGERLRVHPGKAEITRVRDGLDVLGYRVYPDFRLLRNDNGHRFARKLRRFAREYAAGSVSWKEFDPAVQSWIGHSGHADAEGLRRRIFESTVFVRGSGQESASVCSVAARGTTNRTGCVPPTATGTRETTATTTLVSGSPITPA